MCERRDTLKALTDAADKLVATCLRQVTPAIVVPDAHVPGVVKALRHAIRRTSKTPADMNHLLGKIK